MLILITYDVSLDEGGARRLRRIARLCLNYGQRVQNSVFECMLDRTQYTRLKHEIEAEIDHQRDSIRFYFMGDHWTKKVVQLGKNDTYDPTAELII